MSIKWKPIYAIFASTLTFIACSGGSNSSSETTVPTTLPAATTTTIDPTEAAGGYYLEIVSPANCLRDLYQVSADQFNKTSDERWKNEWNYDEVAYFVAFKSEVMDNARILSDGLVKFASDLGAYDWPSEVQGSIDLLIAQMLAEGSAYSSWSNLNSWDQLEDWKWPKSDEENYAGVIRAKLGIASNVNSDVNNCKEVFG